jgi:6,7-dimethyl-8-ribityllumazine synthase
MLPYPSLYLSSIPPISPKWWRMNSSAFMAERDAGFLCGRILMRPFWWVSVKNILMRPRDAPNRTSLAKLRVTKRVHYPRTATCKASHEQMSSKPSFTKGLAQPGTGDMSANLSQERASKELQECNILIGRLESVLGVRIHEIHMCMQTQPHPVHARWNLPVVEALVEGALEVLSPGQPATASNAPRTNVTVKTVSGSWELPIAIKSLITQAAATGRPYHAAIGVGVLIKGDTDHYHYIASACSQGLMQVGLDTGVPVVFGVLTCKTEEQAMERCGIATGSHNHGVDWGHAALEMALLCAGCTGSARAMPFGASSPA